MLHLLLISLPALIAWQDTVPGLKFAPRERAFESGRSVFASSAVKDLALRPVPGEYVVFAVEGTREVVQVGDRLGLERYLVLAITDNRLLFQKRDGFALMYRDGGGETVIQDIDEAHLSPEFMEMAPKPE